MHRFGAAGNGQPGFIEAKTLRDNRSGRLVGMARWEDEASWRAGVEAMRAAVEDDPFDEWEAADDRELPARGSLTHADGGRRSRAERRGHQRPP